MTDKPAIILPFVGEFGSKLAKHCPGVHGYALANSAIGHRQQDEIYEQIRDHYGPDYQYITDRQPMRFTPVFFTPTTELDIDYEFDVLLLARKKSYAAGRNWAHWLKFYEALTDRGIRCLIGGQKDSCLDLPCPGVWDLVDDPRDVLEATIWGINNSKLRVGSTTGTTFLSLLCAKPVLMIMSELGMDAFGSKHGFNAETYYKMDHERVGWGIISHWTDWQKSLDEFLYHYDNVQEFEKWAMLAVRGLKGVKK
jgi:hypothetical protein